MGKGKQKRKSIQRRGFTQGKTNFQRKTIIQGDDPRRYYLQSPAWVFENADREQWAFSWEHLGDVFWIEILPTLVALESQTWSEILVRDKKKNHSIDLADLNKVAQARLVERYIEAESLISIRLSGKHRLYGYITGYVFNILWYDENHGDNETCVCRSRKKHT